MFKANSEGKVLGIGYQPGKSATLVRNPNWNPSTDFRPAYLDQININIGGDPTVIGRQVLEGLGHGPERHAGRSRSCSSPTNTSAASSRSPRARATHYIAVNNKQGPFSNIDLRKAFWAALDRVAMNKARGGVARDRRDDPLPLSRNPRLRRGRRSAGAEGRLQRTPRRRHGGRRKVHEARGLPERQVHRRQDARGRRRDRRSRPEGRRNRQPDA